MYQQNKHNPPPEEKNYICFSQPDAKLDKVRLHRFLPPNKTKILTITNQARQNPGRANSLVCQPLPGQNPVSCYWVELDGLVRDPFVAQMSQSAAA